MASGDGFKVVVVVRIVERHARVAWWRARHYPWSEIRRDGVAVDGARRVRVSVEEPKSRERAREREIGRCQTSRKSGRKS